MDRYPDIVAHARPCYPFLFSLARSVNFHLLHAVVAQQIRTDISLSFSSSSCPGWLLRRHVEAAECTHLWPDLLPLCPSLARTSPLASLQSLSLFLSLGLSSLSYNSSSSSPRNSFPFFSLPHTTPSLSLPYTDLLFSPWLPSIKPKKNAHFALLPSLSLLTLHSGSGLLNQSA